MDDRRRDRCGGRRVAAAAFALISVVGTAACTPPALGSEDYRASAARTAGDASSDLAAASVICTLARENRAWQPYLRVLASDAEDSLSGIENTFSALQPPSRSDVATRHDLLDLLAVGGNEVAAVRLAVYADRLPAADCDRRLEQLQTQFEAAAAALSGQAVG